MEVVLASSLSDGCHSNACREKEWRREMACFLARAFRLLATDANAQRYVNASLHF